MVALYRRLQKTKPRIVALEAGDTVAGTVAGSHPDVALKIWKKIADKLIGEAKPSAYVRAAGYLHRPHGRVAKPAR